MITKKEIDFMLEMFYNKHGMISAKEQKTYVINSHFYEVITKLRAMNLISSVVISNELIDRRISLYELTIRGVTLIKILKGDDY